LGKFFDGYIDETTYQDKKKRGENMSGGDSNLSEDQGNYVHFDEEKKEDEDEEKEDHKQESQGIKKHKALPFDRKVAIAWTPMPGPGARVWDSKIMRRPSFHGPGRPSELRIVDCGMRIETQRAQ
jgi:hypothetical protein